jgi:hypothetical protein
MSHPSFVYKTVFDYHQGCALASPYLQDVDPDDSSFLSALAQYCPNSMAPSVLSDEDRGMDLYQVASLDLPEDGAPLSNCGTPSEHQTGNLTILIPEQLSDGDIAHFPAFIGDIVSEASWVSWGAAEDEDHCIADFCSMEGVPGMFHPPYALTVARAFLVEGLDVGAMQDKKQELSSSGVYQIINNNCSHKLLQILAAGMGCDAEIIPFYLPSALVNALETMDNVSELLEIQYEDIEIQIENYLAEAM